MSKQRFSDGEKACTLAWLSALVLAGLAAFNTVLQAEAAESTIGELITRVESERKRPAKPINDRALGEALLNCGDDPACIDVEMISAGYVWRDKKWRRS